MFLVAQQILMVVFSFIFLAIFGLINYKLAKIKLRYAFILPGTLSVLGIGLIIFAYIVNLGWESLAYLLFGMMALMAGILSALISLGLVKYLSKTKVKPISPTQNIDLNKLSELNRLHRDGNLTKEEYEQEKAKILN